MIGDQITAADTDSLPVLRDAELFRSFAEQSPVGLFLTDPHGGCRYANEQAAVLMGQPADSCRGDGWVGGLHPEDAERVWHHWRGAVQGQGPFREEFRFRHGDGTVFWVDGCAAPQRDADGRLTGFLGTLIDVTAKVEAREALQEANEHVAAALAELQSSQEELVKRERRAGLGELASGLAHELNNALSPILAFSDLLRVAKQWDDRIPVWANQIHEATKNAGRMVSRLREFYRKDDAPHRPEEFSVADLLHTAAELTRIHWREDALAQGSVIDVRFDLIEGVTLVADKSDLLEAVANLIRNAVDAMPASGELTLLSRGSDEWIEIGVSDTGTGMDALTKSRCLEPFFTTKTGEGTGLGLGITQRIAERHGGVVEIESAPGVGSIVWMRFPNRAAESNPNSGAERPAAGCGVLLIDDDDRVRSAIRRVLEHLGYVVRESRDSTLGLESFLADPADVVITDFGMPGLDGRAVIQRIKAESPGTPVVLMTGWQSIDLSSMPQGLRPDVVLAKPVALADLREAMAAITA